MTDFEKFMQEVRGSNNLDALEPALDEGVVLKHADDLIAQYNEWSANPSTSNPESLVASMRETLNDLRKMERFIVEPKQNSEIKARITLIATAVDKFPIIIQ